MHLRDQSRSCNEISIISGTAQATRPELQRVEPATGHITQTMAWRPQTEVIVATNAVFLPFSDLFPLCFSTSSIIVRKSTSLTHSPASKAWLDYSTVVSCHTLKSARVCQHTLPIQLTSAPTTFTSSFAKCGHQYCPSFVRPRPPILENPLILRPQDSISPIIRACPLPGWTCPRSEAPS